jgi:hypothetical protein
MIGNTFLPPDAIPASLQLDGKKPDNLGEFFGIAVRPAVP